VIYPAIELVAGRDLGREGVTSALRYPHEHALNPRMLLYGLLNTSLARQYIRVFENSEVTGVTREGVFTKHGVVYANDIVLATGCLPEGAFPGFPQVGQKATDIVIAYRYKDRVPPAWREGNCWTFEKEASGVARPIIGEWCCPINEQTIVMGGPVADCPVDKVDDYWPSFTALCKFRDTFLPGQGQVVACWPGACTISVDGLLYAGRINGAFMVEAFNGAGLVGAATGANVVAALIAEGTHPNAYHFGFERPREPIGLGARVHEAAMEMAA
jgi:glycine/D-amino acid oxidase-like deaminating enzyme